jgi:MFS family permease
MMRDLDPVGQALAVIALFAVVFALIQGPEMGWASGPMIAIYVVAATALVRFVRFESKRRDPFIDLWFFRSTPFLTATVIAVCGFATYGAFLFMMSVYLQGVRHYSAVHTGLLYLPIAVAALAFSPQSGRLVGRFGSRPSLLVAGVMLTAGTVLLATISMSTPVGELVGIFTVFGIGFAMVNAPITTAAVSGMPTERAGAASAVASTSRQVGVSIGVALCGSVAGASLSATNASFVAGARALWFVCAGLSCASLCWGWCQPRRVRGVPPSGWRLWCPARIGYPATRRQHRELTLRRAGFTPWPGRNVCPIHDVRPIEHR